MIDKKSSLYQRAARVMLSALIAEDFSQEELRRIAQEFSAGNFSHGMNVLIEDVLFSLKAFATEDPRRREPSRETSLHELVKRKRLSKSAVAGAVNVILPRFFSPSEIKRLTLGQMVDMFLQVATASQEGELVDRLGGTAGDHFLRGIMRK